MNAIITGITGFAGMHLAEHLLAAGDAVSGVSQRGKWLGVGVPRLRNVSLLAWNIEQPAPPSTLARINAFAPDVIYHLAAISVPSQCGEEAPTTQANAVNVDGTRHVLELAASLTKRPRVMLVSSRHVYRHDATPHQFIDESATIEPHGGYGRSKLAAENAALAANGISIVIARAFNHTGPRQMPPLFVPQWCEQIARRQLPLLIHNEHVWLDLSDVRDVVRAYRLLALHGASGEVYNVGSGRAWACGDIARKLLAIAGISLGILSAHDEELHNPIADTRKLHLLTGWQPQIPLETTLADTWQFWVEQNREKS